MASYRIGQLAERAGVAIDTVRYYERNGLLRPAERLASGYRCYGDEELQRLRFIRRAKALGFSLDEVRDLLDLSQRRDLAEVKQAAQGRLADLERRIDELQRMRSGLQDLIAACPGHGHGDHCPILNALTQESQS